MLLRASKTDATASKAPLYKPSSARDAVERGTDVLKQGNTEEAVRLFRLGMTLSPNQDEARAALYNLGCALAKQKKWAEASSSIITAINDYNLKLIVALKDDDLQELRDRREWLDALNEVKGGLSRNTKVDLRTEAKAPFRFPRIIFFGSLLASAGLGLIVIITRLIASLQGGEGAPDLQESLTNFGVNITAVVVLSFLLYRDVSSKQKAVSVTTREELLGRLQVDLGKGRVLPLLKFRGQVRPVIVAGSRVFVERAIKDAERQYLNLRDRAVSVIPVAFDVPVGPKEVDPEEKIRALKKEFQKEGKGFSDKKAPAAASASASEDDDEARGGKKATVMGGLVDADKKWRLEPYDLQEWKTWVIDQKEFASLPSNEPNCWIQIQLDGTVRSSGTGTPPWNQFVEDLPTLESFRTRLMDGVGPQE